MNVREVMAKAERDEGLTVEEVKIYQANSKPVKHVYGKYGTLAKQYLEEHNVAKYWALAGDLPEYLHGIDKAAAQLYDTMYAKLSQDERYKKTSNYIENVQRETEMQKLIEEEILNELVYV